MRYLILLSAMLAITGCANQWYTGEQWYKGEWTVTDAKLPGISAIGLDELPQWYGAEALYSDTLVTFRDARCEQPQFAVKEIGPHEFNSEFRATFAALDITDSSVQVLEVGCPGRWTEPGATFIQAGPDSGYVLWDGAFFKLVRQSEANEYSYQCESGTQVDVRYPDTETAQITYQGNSYELAIAMSASGARYLGKGLEWWSKGTGPGASGTLARVNAESVGDAQIIERCEQM